MEPRSHHITVPRTARYFTLGDPEAAGGNLEDAWFLFHGYGQLASEFLEQARALARPRRLLVVPEGLSRFYHADHEKIGASWMTREERLTEIEDYIRYLDGLHEKLSETLPLAGVPLRYLGYSQGVATAARCATHGKAPVDRLVVWGSPLPPDLDSAATARLAGMRVTLVAGRRDRFFTEEQLEQQSTFLRDLGVAFEVKRFEGGHRLDDATLRSLGGPISVDEILNLRHPEPDHRLPYGEDPLQFGELRIPGGKGPHPVVIVIHGGCWRARYDVSHTRAFTEALRKNGLAVWSLEYRRVGNEGGGWPGTFLDVAAGADHLRQLAATHRIDLARAVVFGHSAGGHLALWLAGSGRLGERSDIRGSGSPLELQGVVTLAAVTDLERALRDGVCDSMAAELLGGLPGSVPSRYRAASPIHRLPLGVPQRLLTGAADTLVSPKFGEDYARRGRALGDDVTHVVLEDAGHFEGIAPDTRAFHSVLEAIQSLAARWD